jgi:hypothetical protein
MSVPKLTARAINAMVPTHDSLGFLYSSREVRTMRKKIRGGNTTSFILTDGERQALKDRKEDRDDDDLMGVAVYKKVEVGEKRKLVKGDGEEDGEDENKDEEGGDEDGVKEGSDADAGSASDDDDDDDDDDSATPKPAAVSPTQSHVQSGRKNKPVPPGYSCKACNQSGAAGAHWIVDCPKRINKKTGEVVGVKEAVVKKAKGIFEPSANKLFVSGLSFEATKKEVTELFSRFGLLKSLQLLTFKDSSRCNGQGFVEFAESDDARKAMAKMNGTVVGGRELKVTNVQRRDVTQKGKKGGGKKESKKGGEGGEKKEWKGKGGKVRQQDKKRKVVEE